MVEVREHGPMLTTLQKSLKQSLFGLAVLPGVLLSAEAKEAIKSNPAEARPPGLLVILERPVPYGSHLMGVYALKADPHRPGLWQIKLWDELPNEMKVISETVRCSPEAPMRVTSNGSNLLVRELNPGGQIHPGNRIDHLIWWATCYPQQAGKDPATLGPLARSLGYSGALRESEQVLPGRGN
ncbi:hypothetical protein [Cyanobium sp. HWJ4-Hawea]|uniref:hypothetical protein n=1 Tax=Cyanobium sp. HWJ4-Hawea TaxID=2823713 RepID=UPI0020CF2CB3|nr:hypothetical protein [Cyanobium sp. HWJ4-Hawea]